MCLFFHDLLNTVKDKHVEFKENFGCHYLLEGGGGGTDVMLLLLRHYFQIKERERNTAE